MTRLTHIDETGAARMVDVGAKDDTERTAVARAFVRMQPETLEMITEGGFEKGDVLGVARIAGIQAAKRTADLIPLCHPLMLTRVEVDLQPVTDASCVAVTATCALRGKTGVEMEALTAASVAALTVYDMCKAVDRGMIIDDLRVIEKRGGKSGHWRLEGEALENLD